MVTWRLRPTPLAEGRRCKTENCARVLGAPRDRDGFCDDCADAIEEQDREHAMGDEQ